MVKNLPNNTGDARDTGSIPGLGRSPGGGHDNPLQYFCLENPMDRSLVDSEEEPGSLKAEASYRVHLILTGCGAVLKDFGVSWRCSGAQHSQNRSLTFKWSGRNGKQVAGATSCCCHCSEKSQPNHSTCHEHVASSKIQMGFVGMLCCMSLSIPQSEPNCHNPRARCPWAHPHLWPHLQVGVCLNLTWGWRFTTGAHTERVDLSCDLWQGTDKE